MKLRKTLEILTRAAIISGTIFTASCTHTNTRSEEWTPLMNKTKKIVISDPGYIKEIESMLEREAIEYGGKEGERKTQINPHEYSRESAVDILNSNIKSRNDAQNIFKSIVFGYQMLNKRTEPTIIDQAKKDVEAIIERERTLLELYANRAQLDGGKDNCVIYSMIALCALTGRAIQDIHAGKIDRYEIDVVSGMEYALKGKLSACHQWVVAENQEIDRLSPPVKKDRTLIPLVGATVVIKSLRKDKMMIENRSRVYTLPYDLTPSQEILVQNN